MLQAIFWLGQRVAVIRQPRPLSSPTDDMAQWRAMPLHYDGGEASNCPVSTAVTTANLTGAIVYDTAAQRSRTFVVAVLVNLG